MSCYVPRGTGQRDGSAIKFDRVDNAFHFSFISLAEQFIDEEGEQIVVPGENPCLRKCHILMPEDSSPKRDSNPHNIICGRLGKQAY